MRGLSVGFKDFQSKNVPGKSRVDTMVDSCCFFMDLTGVDRSLSSFLLLFCTIIIEFCKSLLFLLSTWNTPVVCAANVFPSMLAVRASCMKKEDDFEKEYGCLLCFRQTKRRFLEVGWCIGTSILWFGRWFTSFHLNLLNMLLWWWILSDKLG